MTLIAVFEMFTGWNSSKSKTANFTKENGFVRKTKSFAEHVPPLSSALTRVINKILRMRTIYAWKSTISLLNQRKAWPSSLKARDNVNMYSISVFLTSAHRIRIFEFIASSRPFVATVNSIQMHRSRYSITLFCNFFSIFCCSLFTLPHTGTRTLRLAIVMREFLLHVNVYHANQMDTSWSI